MAIRVWAALTVGFLAFNFVSIALLAPVLFPSEFSAAHVEVEGMAVAFGHHNVAGGLNDFVDLVFLAIGPLGILLIFAMMLGRLARSVRKWWPTHRLLTAALVVLLAGACFVQGQALVSRSCPSREHPPSSRAKDRRHRASTPARRLCPLSLRPAGRAGSAIGSARRDPPLRGPAR